MKKNIINTTGTLKLKDNLEIVYGVYTGEEFIDLSSKLDGLVGQDVEISIIDDKTGITFEYIGKLTKRKTFVDDYFIEDINLSDILWELTETKVKIILDICQTKENTEDKEN